MTGPTTEWRFSMDWRLAMKLAIYSLLLVNFGLYILEEIYVASFTMRNGGTLLEWTAAFATTIDLSAWFTLLFLLELETFALADEFLEKPWVVRLLHGLRMFCYLSLAHSVYAFGTIYLDLLAQEIIPGVTSLCQLVGPDVSFTRNIEYVELTSANCNNLSADDRFLYTEDGLVVTDRDGFVLEKRLALVDWLEVIFWLVILLTIEIMVRLQERGITRGPWITAIKASKVFLYGGLWVFAGWWLSLGHVYYAWDEALWIVGFITIEMNMRQWKKEIEEGELPESAATPAGSINNS